MRYAVLAASNFLGTSNQLAGCINDLINVKALIEPSGIKILAELRDHDMTAVNWKSALQLAALTAVEGDIIFHAHSHHGAQIRDSKEPDGLDECWCADGFDWSPESMITDKWMFQLISSLKTGVLWVDLCDACHAGDSLRQMWCPKEKPRYIPNPDISLETKLSRYVDKDIIHTLKPMVIEGEDRKGILLAACRSNQTSADANINGKACGAFTNYLLQSISETPKASYESLMLRTTELLGLGGYDQKPEIDCLPLDIQRTWNMDIMGQS